MKRVPLSFPEIGVISGTRAAFGAGLALLLALRLSDEQRRAVGWTLLAFGAVTTVPIVVQLLRSQGENGGRLEHGEVVSGGMGRRQEYAS